MLIYCLLRLFCPLLKGKLNVPLAPEKWLKPSHREKSPIWALQNAEECNSAVGNRRLAVGVREESTGDQGTSTGDREATIIERVS